MPGLLIARTVHEGSDGPEARVVVAAPGTDGWVDLRRAERLRLERAGATTAGARRLAAALVPPSLSAALGGGAAFEETARAAVADPDPDALIDGEPRFLRPIDPVAYRDFMAFERHFVDALALSGATPNPVLYEMPVSYFGNPDSILGPEDEIPWPHYTRRMDFELELGVVLGRGGRDVTPDTALDHVLGVTVFNDFSARDIQLREMGGNLGPSKGKHFGSSVGPWIATLDAVDVENLAMTARVNGETWTESNSGTIMWSLAELVAWAAAGEPIAAGMLLGSGTVGGGCRPRASALPRAGRRRRARDRRPRGAAQPARTAAVRRLDPDAEGPRGTARLTRRRSGGEARHERRDVLCVERRPLGGAQAREPGRGIAGGRQRGVRPVRPEDDLLEGHERARRRERLGVVGEARVVVQAAQVLEQAGRRPGGPLGLAGGERGEPVREEGHRPARWATCRRIDGQRASVPE